MWSTCFFQNEASSSSLVKACEEDWWEEYCWLRGMRSEKARRGRRGGGGRMNNTDLFLLWFQDQPLTKREQQIWLLQIAEPDVFFFLYFLLLLTLVSPIVHKNSCRYAFALLWSESPWRWDLWNQPSRSSSDTPAQQGPPSSWPWWWAPQCPWLPKWEHVNRWRHILLFPEVFYSQAGGVYLSSPLEHDSVVRHLGLSDAKSSQESSHRYCSCA